MKCCCCDWGRLVDKQRVSDDCTEKRAPTEACVSDREGRAIFSTAHHSFICNF